jgi:hypothetical protein
MQKENASNTQGVPVEYAQLADQPNVYRGKLVTVRGIARKITQEKPAENDLGIEAYYSVVIQPADGANWPIVVYCLELPEKVAPGDDSSLDVVVNGLFFKKLSYRWRDGLGIAPVIVANRLTTNVGAAAANDVSPKAADSQGSSKDKDNSTLAGTVDFSGNRQEAFQQIMSLSGWNADRLAKLKEGDSLSAEQRVEVLELLRRLRSISTEDLSTWTSNMGLKRGLKDPEPLRGRLCQLIGLVTKVTKHVPAAADAERLEMPVYYECEFKDALLADPVTIMTARIPKDWRLDEPMKEVGKANGMFVKRLNGETATRTLWVAKEMAWHPPYPSWGKKRSIEDLYRGGNDPLLGKSVLGSLHMDVGKFDLVEPRGRIRPQERFTFYETMYIAGSIEPSTLIRIANDNLPLVKQEWEQRLRDGGSAPLTALAREVVCRADQGRYSVALLFNDPRPQIGRLFVFDGAARRAVRVEVGEVASDVPASSNPVVQFDIDHYYELEVFTDDSQNYPLIFCVSELPKDFPIGADIHVPVRVAGFFFKNWLYQARGRGHADESSDAQSIGPQAQFAPLLIGRAPIVLQSPQPVGHAGGFVLGGLFILALASICAAAIWVSRSDRRFRERAAAAKFELPPGQSLNDLNVPAADVPMMDKVSGVRCQVSEEARDTDTR